MSAVNHFVVCSLATSGWAVFVALLYSFTPRERSLPAVAEAVSDTWSNIEHSVKTSFGADDGAPAAEAVDDSASKVGSREWIRDLHADVVRAESLEYINSTLRSTELTWEEARKIGQLAYGRVRNAPDDELTVAAIQADVEETRRISVAIIIESIKFLDLELDDAKAIAKVAAERTRRPTKRRQTRKSSAKKSSAKETPLARRKATKNTKAR